MDLFYVFLIIANAKYERLLCRLYTVLIFKKTNPDELQRQKRPRTPDTLPPPGLMNFAPKSPDTLPPPGLMNFVPKSPDTLPPPPGLMNFFPKSPDTLPPPGDYDWKRGVQLNQEIDDDGWNKEVVSFAPRSSETRPLDAQVRKRYTPTTPPYRPPMRACRSPDYPPTGNDGTLSKQPSPHYVFPNPPTAAVAIAATATVTAITATAPLVDTSIDGEVLKVAIQLCGSVEKWNLLSADEKNALLDDAEQFV